MKSLIVSISLSLLAQSAVAGVVPVELKNLIPAGRSEISYQGHTLDGRDCSLEVFSAKDRFSATLNVYTGFGDADLFRSHKFQLGDRYELTEQKIIASTVNYESTIQQHDSERAQRVTLKLHKEVDKLKAAQLLVEEESYIGFSTISKETCFMK